jgi:hypothetical protein
MNGRWSGHALLALALTGCATYTQVRHVEAPANLAAADLPRLSRMVAVMETAPPEGPAGILGKAAGNLAKSLDPDSADINLPPAEALDLLRAAAQALSSPATQITAIMTSSPSATAFADALNATSVLWLAPSPIRARQEEGEQEVYDRDTGRSFVRRVMVRRVGFSMQYRLESWPDRRVLATRSFTDGARAAAGTREGLRSWALEQRAVRQSWLGGLRADLLPMAVWRGRLVQKGKSRGLKDGLKAVKNGDWDRACGAWEAESRTRDDYRLKWNLGLCREKEGRWGEARDLYAAARNETNDSDDARTLGDYLAQLGRVYEEGGQMPLAANSGGIWFAEQMAVLPFANDSNNMGAAERAREMVFQRLARLGYPVLPLDETDRRLRDIGLSDGGQLRAFAPDKLAQAAGANLILAGTVREFKTTNVGLYNLHHVALILRLTDETGRVLWEADGVGYREILFRPADAGKAFLGGLIESAVGKVTGSDLEEEMQTAVLTGLSSLPARPAASGARR